MPEPTMGDDVTVHAPRHPADALTGCRVESRGHDSATAVLALPEQTASLGHLGMVADICTAQAMAGAVPEGQGFVTLGLHLHLVGSVVPGSYVRGVGERLSFDGTSGLSRALLTNPDGSIAAAATGRFMVVEERTKTTGTIRRQPLADLKAPDDWDWALGIVSSEHSGGTAVLRAVPHSNVRNHAPMMHGGIHLRALELAIRAAIEEPGRQPVLTDLDVAFHRPVPADGETAVLLRGAVERSSRRVITATGSLETTDGRLLSSGHATFLRPNEA